MKIEVLEEGGEYTVFGLVEAAAGEVLAEARIERNSRMTLTSFTSIEVRDLEWFIAGVKLIHQRGLRSEAPSHVLEVAASADFSKVIITADSQGLARLLAVIAALRATQERGLNDHDHLWLQVDGEGDLTPTDCGEGWRAVEEIQINAWQRSAIL